MGTDYENIIDEGIIKQLAGHFTMPYLNSFENQWRNADEQLIEFEDMTTKYLSNCLNTLTRTKETHMNMSGYGRDLENDFDDYFYKKMKSVDINTKKLKDNEKEFLKRYIIDATMEILDIKIADVKNEIKRRNSSK